MAASNLGDRLKKAEQSLEKLKKPDGSRENPALSCKDLKACYPNKKDGESSPFACRPGCICVGV